MRGAVLKIEALEERTSGVAEPHANEVDESRQSWDKNAEGYDEFVTASRLWLGIEGLKRAGLRPGERFLDVAAGSGALSIPAARLGADVLATDLSPVMLQRLERRAGAEGVNIRTRVMDGSCARSRE